MSFFEFNINAHTHTPDTHTNSLTRHSHTLTWHSPAEAEVALAA